MTCLGAVLALDALAALRWALPAVPVAVGGVLLWRALLRDPDRRLRRCPACWQELHPSQGLTCPECGRTASGERALHRRRRRWGRAAAGLVLLAAGAGVTAARLPWSSIASWRSAPDVVVIGPIGERYEGARAERDRRLFNGLLSASEAEAVLDRLRRRMAEADPWAPGYDRAARMLVLTEEVAGRGRRYGAGTRLGPPPAMSAAQRIALLDRITADRLAHEQWMPWSTAVNWRAELLVDEYGRELRVVPALSTLIDATRMGAWAMADHDPSGLVVRRLRRAPRQEDGAALLASLVADGWASERTFERAAAGLDDPVVWRRHLHAAVLVAAARLLERPTDALIGLLTDPDPEVADLALRSLRWAGDEPAIAAFALGGLESNDPDVVARAFAALRWIDDEARARSLAAAAVDHPDPNVRSSARGTFVELGGASAHGLTGRVRDLLRRTRARGAGPAGATTTLLEADGDWYLERCAAIEALPNEDGLAALRSLVASGIDDSASPGHRRRAHLLRAMAATVLLRNDVDRPAATDAFVRHAEPGGADVQWPREVIEQLDLDRAVAASTGNTLFGLDLRAIVAGLEELAEASAEAGDGRAGER